MRVLSLKKIGFVCLICPAALAVVGVVTSLDAFVLTVLIGLALVVAAFVFYDVQIEEQVALPSFDRVFNEHEKSVIAQRLAVEAVLGVLVQYQVVDGYSVRRWIEEAASRENEDQRVELIERSMYFAGRMTDLNSPADLSKHL